jgi:serine/threonine protein kinase
METRNFTEKELNDKTRLKLGLGVVHTESDLFLCGKDLVKCFRYPTKKLMDRKIYTLRCLDDAREEIEEKIPELVLPNEYASLNNEVVGFVMDYINGPTLKELITNDNVSFEKKRDALVKVGELLERLKEVRKSSSDLKGFYVNDLHDCNLIVTKDGNLRVVDIDSCKIDGNGRMVSLYLLQPYYSKMYSLDKYRSRPGVILPNSESDIYCYVMMILKFLTGKNFTSDKEDIFNRSLDKMRSNGLPIELYEAFRRVYQEEPNINPYKELKKINSRFSLK